MKKGFTLIELLAIILLISIILGISAPQIFKIVKLYNEESSEASEDILLTAAKEFVEVYHRSILFDVKNLNDCKMISTDDIRDLGLIKQSHLDLIYEDQSFYVKVILLSDSVIKYEVSENLDASCSLVVIE